MINNKKRAKPATRHKQEFSKHPIGIVLSAVASELSQMSKARENLTVYKEYLRLELGGGQSWERSRELG